MTKLINTFSGGLSKDFHETSIPSNKLEHALNVVEHTQRNKYSGLSLEPGNSLYFVFDEKTKVIGRVYDEGRDWLIVFIINSNGYGEIGYIEKGEYTKIISENEYNCYWGFSECEWIIPEIKYFNDCEELHLYWSSGGYSRVINVNDLLNPHVREDLVCQDFLLIRSAPEPNIKTNTVKLGGADIDAGIYQFFVQLEDQDKNKTNWSHGSNLVRIGSPNNRPGESSDEAIDIYIYPLDNRYDKLNLAVRKTVNGVSIQQVIYSGNYSEEGFSYRYYGKTGDEMGIDNEVLLDKKDFYFKNYRLAQHNNQMYFYQIENKGVYNWQEKVNKIRVYPTVNVVPANEAYRFKCFAADENYLPFIFLNYADGTRSHWFPIIGEEDPMFLDDCVSPEYLASEEGGGFDWIKRNNASFPQELIDPFRYSSPPANISGGGGACTSCSTLPGDTNNPSGGGCSNGVCGLNGISEGSVDTLFRNMDSVSFSSMIPTTNEDQYIIDAYNNEFKSRFPQETPPAPIQTPIVGNENITVTDSDSIELPFTAEDSNKGTSLSIKDSDYDDNVVKDLDTDDDIECDDSFRNCIPWHADCGCKGSDHTDCDPCNSDTFIESKYQTHNKSYKLMARACCPQCTEEEIAGVNSLDQAVAFCNENKAKKFGQTVNDYEIENRFQSVDGSTTEGLNPRSSADICYTVTLEYSVNIRLTDTEFNKVSNDHMLLEGVMDIDVIYCADTGEYQLNGQYEFNYNYAINEENENEKHFWGINVIGSSTITGDNATGYPDIDSIITKIKEEAHRGINFTGSGAQNMSIEYGGIFRNVNEEIRDCILDCSGNLVDDDNVPFEDKNAGDFPMTPILADPKDKCSPVIGYKPYKLGKGRFGTYWTEHTYPKTKDCNGNYIFGEYAGANIRLFKTPDRRMVSASIGGFGVKNEFDMSNEVGSETYVLMIGFAAENIELPKDDELPKPLNKKKPYGFGFAKRDEFNSTKISEGIVIESFDGYVYGQKKSYMKHNLNSALHIDRHIAKENTDGLPLRLGEPGIPEFPIYGFFSPDTMYSKPVLYNDHIACYDMIKGQGWRYGLYERGIEIDDRKIGRKNQKVARHALFLSSSELTPEDDHINLKGIDYVEKDDTANIQGIDQPIVNKMRESIVGMQLDERISWADLNGGSHTEVSGGYNDKSFNGYILDHELVISGVTRRVGIKRINRKQYGNLDGMQVVSFGDMLDGPGDLYDDVELVEGGSPNITFNVYKVDGLVGDMFMGIHEVKRHGYVSDKVGNNIKNEGAPFDFPDVDNEITDYIEENLLKGFRLMDCGKPPEDGDLEDKRNFRGLHDNPNVPPLIERDTFYPALTTTVLYYATESRVDLSKTMIGDANEFEFNPKDLKNINNKALDSSLTGTEGWKDGFLNQFYAEMNEMNRSQRYGKLALYLVKTLGPVIAALYVAVSSISGGFLSTLVGVTVAVGIYIVLRELIKFIFTDALINRILNIETCKTDKQGGPGDKIVKGFRDNYNKYNWDYSELDNYFIEGPMPDDIRICDCKEIGNKVIYTNPQIIDSLKDAYRNNNANKYFSINQERGKLVNLVSLGNNLIAHTTDGLYVIKDNDGIKFPIPLMAEAEEGIYGTSMPNAGIKTKFGYAALDIEEGCIYLVAPNLQVVKLLPRNSNWIRNNLSMCTSSSTCPDQKNGNSYHLGYDPEFDRLLVTKDDGKFSYTFSVSLNRESEAFKDIVSFHSYKPDKGYFWNRKNIYYINDNKIWLMNSEKDKFTVYEDVYYGSIIKFIANKYKPENEFMFESFTYASTSMLISNEKWDSESNDYIKYMNKIYDKVMIFNEDQTSGLLKLVQVDDVEKDNLDRIQKYVDSIKVTKEAKHWNINELKDVTVNAINKSLFKKEYLCSVEEVASNYDLTLRDVGIIGKGKLSGRYIGYLFILNDEDNKDTNIILHYLVTNTIAK